MDTTIGTPATREDPPAPMPRSAFQPSNRPKTPAEDLLVATGVTLRYGSRSETGTLALDGVDLRVHPAERLAIMGPSGCGKTTLLHVLAGILRPGTGSVHHAGRDLVRLPDRARTRLRRRSFGFVFQDDRLLPELTAIENTILPRLLDGASRRTATTEATRLLDRLGLAGLHQRRPGQLSGGQAQRVAIARALIARPGVVFADEPTGALDQSTGAEVLSTLLGACEETGAALVMVTHDPAVAARTQRIVTMRDGGIVGEHAPDRSAGLSAEVTA